MEIELDTARWAQSHHTKMGVPVLPPTEEQCPACGREMLYNVKKQGNSLFGQENIVMLGKRICVTAWTQINVGGGCQYGDRGPGGIYTARGPQTDLFCLVE